jgi:hypothetical protein
VAGGVCGGVEVSKTILEGHFAQIPAGNCAQKWVVDDGALTVHVYQRVTGAAVVVDDRIVGVYLTRAAAERAIDPVYQEALALAKHRSGAEWT